MFHFTSDFDKNMNFSLGGLIKSTDGIFKSAKQSKFILGISFKVDAESLMKHYGVVAASDQFFITCGGMNSWADYGQRGNIPQDFIYVLDENGVVAKWKVPYNGNLRDGASPAPDRATMVWSRPEGLTFVAPEVVVSDAPVSEHIGVVGEKISVVGVITSINHFVGTSMGYWDSGARCLTTIKVGESIINYWGYPKLKDADPEVGMQVTVKATVKKFDEHKGVKTTVISRPKFELV